MPITSFQIFCNRTFSRAGTWKFSGKESKGGEVFFDHVCYTIDAFKMSLKRSESKEYAS